MNDKAKQLALASVIKILRKNKLREDKTIIENTSFSLFGGKDYAQIAQKQYEQLSKLLDDAFKTNLQSEKDPTTRRLHLTNFLLKNEVIFRVENDKESLNIRNSHEEFISKRINKHNKDLRKFQLSKNSICCFRDEEIFEDYFVFNPQLNLQSKKSYDLVLSILLTLVQFILYPELPQSFQLGIMFLSLILLSLLIAIFLFRALFHFIIRFFGYDFYFFPNLFKDVSFLESFKPVIQYQKSKNTKIFIATRTLCIIIVTGLFYCM